jgi:hypothetical protein
MNNPNRVEVIIRPLYSLCNKMFHKTCNKIFYIGKYTVKIMIFTVERQ